VIQTERLTLRPYTVADYDAYAAMVAHHWWEQAQGTSLA